MKKILLSAVLASAALAVSAQELTENDLNEIRRSFVRDPQTIALQNILTNEANLKKLALNRALQGRTDHYFKYRVAVKGITDQKQSGRCWMFTSMNVLRPAVIERLGVADFDFSHNFCYFWDLFEKSNLFLENVLATADRPMTDRDVEFFFKSPVDDGGVWNLFYNVAGKYGVVPREVMPETAHSNNTSQMRRLISLKLREDGLELRRMESEGKNEKALEKRKLAMLSEIYRMLSLVLGEPPTEFEWTRKDLRGRTIDRRRYTPQEFYNEYCGNDLRGDYVMLMNDPTRPYYKLYEIDLDRHTYDGDNWTYINLPVDEIKKAAIRSIKDSTMMYFSCDVGQCFDRDRGLLDPDNFSYGDLLGTTFGMDKADRIRTFASASSHAMTLMAVDLDADGKPMRWMVGNSWGPGANDGHLVMTDRWFDEYMFRLVVNKKYLPAEILDLMHQKPELLPAWDPMFSNEE